MGCLFNVPIIVCQNVFAAEAARVTAIVLFFQTVSGAIWVAAAQSLFTNDIIKYIATNLKSVTPAFVVGTGATELRKTFNAEQLPVVLSAYMAGLRKAFLLPVPLACIGAAIALVAVVFDYRVLVFKKAHANAEAVPSQSEKEADVAASEARVADADDKPVRSREDSTV